MDYSQEYKQKLVSADEAVKLIGLAFAASLLISLIFGGNIFSSLLNKLIDYIRDIITGVNRKKSLRVLAVIVAVVIALSPMLSDGKRLAFIPYDEKSGQSDNSSSQIDADVMCRIMSAESACFIGDSVTNIDSEG